MGTRHRERLIHEKSILKSTVTKKKNLKMNEIGY